jgi:hypothetical protein
MQHIATPAQFETVTRSAGPQLAGRWGFHTESVRRLLRQHAMESLIVCRRRLIPLAEIERVEKEGHVARAN